MKKTALLITALFSTLLSAPAAFAADLPNCYTSSDPTNAIEVPGEYDLTMDVRGRSAREIMDFIAELTTDPIWPDGPMLTSGVYVDSYHYLFVSVVPNMNRFPRGADVQSTRPSVEAKIKEIARLPGVTVSCLQGGE